MVVVSKETGIERKDGSKEKDLTKPGDVTKKIFWFDPFCED